ncbi:hypothetical protein ACI79C_06995 [Geodermatophilus sp. SYSU D00697]
MHQPTTSPQPATLGPGAHEIPVPGTATGTQHLPRADFDGPPVQATGPVDFVPGLPGTPPPTAAPKPRQSDQARTRREPRTGRGPRGGRAVSMTPRQRASLMGAGVAGLSLVLLEVGLLLPVDTGALWSAVPLWSAFATLAGVLGLLPFAGRVLPSVRRRPEGAWRVAAAGLTGLAVFWVLVVLPAVDSNRGFVLTAALATLGAALWIAPVRRR